MFFPSFLPSLIQWIHHPGELIGNWMDSLAWFLSIACTDLQPTFYSRAEPELGSAGQSGDWDSPISALKGLSPVGKADPSLDNDDHEGAKEGQVGIREGFLEGTTDLPIEGWVRNEPGKVRGVFQVAVLTAPSFLLFPQQTLTRPPLGSSSPLDPCSSLDHSKVWLSGTDLSPPHWLPALGEKGQGCCGHCCVPNTA